MGPSREHAALAAALVFGLGFAASLQAATPAPSAPAEAYARRPQPSAYAKTRHEDPARTEIADATGWVATFTDDSYTVTHRGAARTFSEPLAAETGGTQTVSHNVYVRVLASPWAGGLPSDAQVNALIATTAPDVLALGMQYVNGAPEIHAGGLRIAGNAEYGPTVGADFNDYLGIEWDYGRHGGVDAPEAAEYGRLDCSGFMRMIFGYRAGVPLTRDYRPGYAIPRISREMCDTGTGVGVEVIADAGSRPPDTSATYARLRVGDVVCFDSSEDDGVIDHVGIFLGVDNEGRHRILNSRNSLKGPTMKDAASGTSPSVLEGAGWMPNGFRGALRF